MEGRKIVGWNVRKLRVALGFSIEELADRAGLGDSFVSKLERGHINASVDNLELLAKPLRAELADLFVKPQPGEQPPVPLKAGRRPQRQSAAGPSLRPQNQPDPDLLAQLLRRARIAAKELNKFLHLYFKASRGSGSAREILLRMREMDLSPGVARMVDWHLEADSQRRKGPTAQPSKPKEQPSEQVRIGRKHQKPQGLTRGRSPH